MEKSMASFPDLRPGSRSAKAGSVAVRALRSPILLAVSAALLLTAFFAVSELATLRGAKAHDASAYLTRELGSPLSSGSLVRSPARGLKVRVQNDWFAVKSDDHSLRLASHEGGRWRAYERGFARRTPFGAEAISVHGNRTEQSLLVRKPQGRRTWTWELDSKLKPRLTPTGSVQF